jgi:acyl-CoA thioesterase-2
VPSSADELVELLDLETIDINLFRGTQPDTILQRVFGGQVAGQALVAGARTVEDRLSVHSLHSYFLRPGDTAVPIVYDVERIRDGRSFSTRRIVARQHGHAIYYMTASFQVHEEGLEHQDAMPQVSAPDESVDLSELFRSKGTDSAEWMREWAALELRFVGDSREGGNIPNHERPSQSRFWIRVRGKIADEPLLHQAAFTYASDMTLLGSALVAHDMQISHPKLTPHRRGRNALPPGPGDQHRRRVVLEVLVLVVENGPDQAAQRLRCRHPVGERAHDEVDQPLLAEERSVGGARLDHAVGVEEHVVARLERLLDDVRPLAQQRTQAERHAGGRR